MAVYDEVRGWMHRNARPLELEKWKYHFENGSKDDVMNMLNFFQNSDGGMGHALESDNWNPNSTPLTSGYAMDIIMQELYWEDADHPVVQGLLSYINSRKGFNGSVWEDTIPSNNDYPHAPWWTHDPSSSNSSYNPAATLAGFGLRYAHRGSDTYNFCLDIAGNAIDAALNAGIQTQMHICLCYQGLQAGLDYIKHEKAAEMAAHLKSSIEHCILADKDAWGMGYVCMPSNFVKSPEDDFSPEIIHLARLECRHILDNTGQEGVWMPAWSWHEYPQQYGVSMRWWAASGAVINMKLLRAFGFC